ncbi:MAG: biopolymer transporter ExbD [Prochloron sp. SP5CPC1]|nr:biopolymer transporter ExbD [Candidatus Paraprochloron terpiosi SP5CPC1]
MTRRNSGIPTRPLKLWQDSVRSEEARIEILPLIDVIFCILVFFILAAVGISRQQGIDLDLPKASTASATLQEMLVVSLDDEGNVYVEEKQIYTQNQLFRQLSQYFITNPNGVIALNASRKVDYNEVVELLDMLRLVGGDRVALSTSPGYPDRSVFLNLEGTGKGEQGTENKEQGTENKEPGNDNKEL